MIALGLRLKRRPAAAFLSKPLTRRSLLGGGAAASAFVGSRAFAAGVHIIVPKVRWFDPVTFGADPSGVTDSTVALQYCFNQRYVRFETAGTYLYTAPLTGGNGVKLISAAGPGQVQMLRSVAAGAGSNGINLGNTATPTAAGAVEIDSMWFTVNHGGTYVAGSAGSLTGLLSGGERHISIKGGQDVKLNDVWLWDSQYGAEFDCCPLVKLYNLQTKGLWDPAVVSLQEAIASLYFNNISKATFGSTQLIELYDCYIAGGYAPPTRTVTFPDGSTQSIGQNVGPQDGLLITQSEGLLVKGGYIGGQSSNGAHLTPNTDANSNFNIESVFFDGSGVAANTASILAAGTGAGSLVNLIVANCRHSGEAASSTFLMINANGSAASSVYGADIHDNQGQLYAMAPYIFRGAKSVKLHGNKTAAYNCFGSTSATYLSGYGTAAGVYAGGVCTDFDSHDNSWGGGVNDPTGSTNNGAKWGEVYDQTVFQPGASGILTARNVRAQGSGMGIGGGALLIP